MALGTGCAPRYQPRLYEAPPPHRQCTEEACPPAPNPQQVYLTPNILFPLGTCGEQHACLSGRNDLPTPAPAPPPPSGCPADPQLSAIAGRWHSLPFIVCRLFPYQGVGWPRDALEGGEPHPHPALGRPANAQPLSPERQVPASMAPVTDGNRPQPLWQPLPTAYLTASGAASEVPSLPMHPWAWALASLGSNPSPRIRGPKAAAHYNFAPVARASALPLAHKTRDSQEAGGRPSGLTGAITEHHLRTQ